MSADNSIILQSGLSDTAQKMLDDFWPEVMDDIKKLGEHQYKSQELPLARIKKIMKLDEDVKMISAEAPVLFAKAAEIFVRELSLRAWIHTEDNKRRTLQRNDIAMAISKYDQFDFLIDIVPREELKTNKRQDELSRASNSIPEQIQYYLHLAQQQSQQQSQQTSQSQPQQPTQQSQPQQTQVSQAAPVLQQIQQTAVHQQQQQATGVATQAASVQLPGGQIIQQQFQIQQPSQPQVIHLPQQLTQVPQVVNPVQNTVMQQLQQQQQIQTQSQQPATQVYQQVITQSGQLETVPIQLTPQQLQNLQLQIQNKVAGQQIVLQSQQAGDPTAQYTQAQPMYQLQQAHAGQQQIFLQTEEAPDGTTDS